MFFLWFMTSLVNYGLLNWTPTIFVSEFGLTKLQANTFAAYGSIPIFFAPIVLGATIDRFGRRPFAIGGALLATLCLTTLALVPYSQPLALVVLTLGGGFAIGVVAVLLWPYSSEVFPTAVRSVGLGVSSSLAARRLEPDAAHRRRADRAQRRRAAGVHGVRGDRRGEHAVVVERHVRDRAPTDPRACLTRRWSIAMRTCGMPRCRSRPTLGPGRTMSTPPRTSSPTWTPRGSATG
jgi:hypothetical protein